MAAFCGTATGGGTMTGAGGSEGCLLNACGLGESSLAFGQQGEQELVTARQRGRTRTRLAASRGARAGLR